MASFMQHPAKTSCLMPQVPLPDIRLKLAMPGVLQRHGKFHAAPGKSILPHAASPSPRYPFKTCHVWGATKTWQVSCNTRQKHPAACSKSLYQKSV